MIFDPTEFNLGTHNLKDMSLSGTSLRINADLDIDTYTRIYKSEIYKVELTPEKAFFLILTKSNKPKIPTITSLLNRKK